jgi:phenylpyruvate tautomerase PptA (4-oxalocrotonate tautomerase family)
MPVVRVTYPEGALTDKQKEALAVPLIDAVMIQEVNPVNEVARNATFIVYNEIPKKNCYVSKEPFWLVEGMTAAGFFNQKRRDEAQARSSRRSPMYLATMASRPSWGASELHHRTYCVSTFCLSRFRRAAGALPGGPRWRLISAT